MVGTESLLELDALGPAWRTFLAALWKGRVHREKSEEGKIVWGCIKTFHLSEANNGGLNSTKVPCNLPAPSVGRRVTPSDVPLLAGSCFKIRSFRIHRTMRKGIEIMH